LELETGETSRVRVAIRGLGTESEEKELRFVLQSEGLELEERKRS